MNRRTFLARSALVSGVGSLGGCLDRVTGGTDESVPNPVDLSGGKFDDDHGMEIGLHGGANGQIYYTDHTPSEHDGPFWFHTLVFSSFPFYFDRRDRGWETEIFYATDFSAVDWTIEDRDTGPTMSAPTAPESFADATSLTYVAESKVNGGMGSGLHPFSDENEAESFVDEYGGRTLAFDDIDRSLVQRLQKHSQHD